jgi:GT2 family glycosyltransferase
VANQNRPPLVILSFNKPDLTLLCVQQALTLEPSRVILVHNGSSNENVQRLKAGLPQIEHLVLPHNHGYSGGANRGLAQAFEKQAEWAIFLTNDCLIQNWPELPAVASLVGPKIFKRKVPVIDSLGCVFEPAQGSLHHLKRRGEFESRPFSFLRQLPFISGAAFLIHQKVFSQTQGFDETLGTYWEDVDLSCRTLKASFELRLEENWQVIHKIGKTCHGHAEYTLFYYQRNRKRVSYKYARVWERPLLAVYLAKDWAKLTFRLVKTGRRHDLHWLKRAIFE